MVNEKVIKIKVLWFLFYLFAKYEPKAEILKVKNRTRISKSNKQKYTLKTEYEYQSQTNIKVK